MLNVYPWADGAGRRLPADLEAVARYVRWEYGPHTEVEFVLAQAWNGAPAPRKGSRGAGLGLRRALAALARALRSLVPGNGRAVRSASAEKRAG